MGPGCAGEVFFGSNFVTYHSFRMENAHAAAAASSQMNFKQRLALYSANQERCSICL